MTAPRDASPFVSFVTDAGEVRYAPVHGAILMTEIAGRGRLRRTTRISTDAFREKLRRLDRLADIAEQQTGG